MSRRRALSALALLVGLALLVVAVIYMAEPARSLPGFFPGHAAHSSHHHVKHGIVAGVVGLALIVLAWFQSGPRRAPAGSAA
jgi:hypothetical protein